MRHRILSVLFALILSTSLMLSLVACQFAPLKGLIFELSDSGEYYEVIGYEGLSQDVQIPAVYNNKPVKSIGKTAFWMRDDITSIKIPNSIEKIDNLAFYNCKNLEEVDMKNGLVIIGEMAFGECDRLTSILIPDSVKSIGARAFAYCDILKSIEIPDSVEAIGEMAFDECKSLSYNRYDNAYYLGNKTNPYIILIKAIATEIESCNIYSATKFVHSKAFLFCQKLALVEIPDSVQSIGDDAFTYSEYASYNEYDNAYYLGNENNPYIILIKAKSTGITSCEINSATKFISGKSNSRPAYTAFFNCNNLTSITMGNSVMSIGSYAFYGCESLESLTISDGVKTIGSYGFFGCSQLKSIEMGNSLMDIGAYAFGSCQSIENINIGGGVSKIGINAFENCSSLTDISVSDDNTVYKSIDGNLYSKNGKTFIQYAIGKTNGSVAIPDSVKEIGERAFYACSSLNSILIPDSVKEIGERAFYACSSLNSVFYNGDASGWDSIIISLKNSNLTSATVYYYSASEPTKGGNYWHYDENGEVVVW